MYLPVADSYSPVTIIILYSMTSASLVCNHACPWCVVRLTLSHNARSVSSMTRAVAISVGLVYSACIIILALSHCLVPGASSCMCMVHLTRALVPGTWVSRCVIRHRLL